MTALEVRSIQNIINSLFLWVIMSEYVAKFFVCYSMSDSRCDPVQRYTSTHFFDA